jgi:hypothetical protein
MNTLLDIALNDIREEYLRARNKFHKFNSDHEGYAVILEELDELWDDIKNNRADDLKRKEAVQVAAMALRFILDLAEPPEQGADDGEFKTEVLPPKRKIICPPRQMGKTAALDIMAPEVEPPERGASEAKDVVCGFCGEPLSQICARCCSVKITLLSSSGVSLAEFDRAYLAMVTPDEAAGRT